MNAPSLAGRYESPLLPIPGATNSVSVAHGRGCKPWLLRCVLVNIASELGHPTESEVDVLSLNNNAANNVSCIVVSATAAELTLSQRAALGMPNRDGSGLTAISTSKWRIKFYAQF